MPLEFDITGAPPGLAEIVAERNRATAERAAFRMKSIRFLIYTLMGIAVLLSTTLLGIVPYLGEPDAEPSIVFSVAYFTPYLIFPFFVIGNHLYNKKIEKPRKAVDAIITALKEATPEELSTAIESGHRPVEITSYLEKVATQGRSLVRAEIDAIQHWVDECEPSGNVQEL